jgi:hypothetical protein
LAAEWRRRSEGLEPVTAYRFWHSRGGGVLAVAIAAAVWLPALHLFFRPDPRALGGELAARQLALWGEDPAARAGEIATLRASNPEWDFMARSFAAWALADRALADPSTKPAALAAIDRMLDDTLRQEKEGGFERFLLPYARRREFRGERRSLFVDGEIARTLALRQRLEEKPEYRALLEERVARIAASMEAGPMLSGESYPDECWVFDQANALAALALADRLDGADHSALARRWIANAKETLVDPRTGLLVSSYRWDGTVLDGPEGSSIWMAASALSSVDPAFARDQYERARSALGGGALGFGWAREWPRSRRGSLDIDSGLPIPLLDASPSSSGLELVADVTFGDRARLTSMLSSLELGAFPVRRDGKLRFAAGNEVGDAVLLYALSQEALR